jgi:hypothetical protein
MKFRKHFLLLSFLLFAAGISFAQNAAKSDSLELIALLKEHAVFNNDPARSTFYTWTSPEQIAELRKSKTLLTKSMSEKNGYSLFDLSIRDSTFKSFLAAKLLQQPQFAKKRFAWTSSWATSMGLNDEKYGDQLIKIVLSDSAYIGCFNPDDLAEPFSFFDVKGTPVSVNEVLRNSRRLAVVFHFNRIDVTRSEEIIRMKNSYGHRTGHYKNEKANTWFREYVILNEKMIRSWSYGTEEIKNDVRSEIRFLERLKDSPFAVQKGYCYYDGCEMTGDSFRADENCYFSLNRYVGTNDYLFNKKKLQAIIDQLNHVLVSQSEPIN